MPSAHDPLLDSPLFTLFADSASDTYFYLHDLQSGYSRWSHNAVQEFGMPGEYMADAYTAWLPHIHPEDRPGYEKNIKDTFAGKTNGVHCCEYRAKDKDGTYLWVRCKGFLQYDAAGKPVLFGGVMNNLGPVAKYDYVTGLYTIHELRRRLTLWGNDCVGGLLLLGLDNFHQINDTYGYQFGNRTLHALAAVLSSHLPQGTLYRMDGDKFAYTLPGGTRAQMEEVFALCRRLADALTLDDKPLPVSLTGGCLLMETGGADLDILYSQVDMALNAAKRTQPGQLLFYSAALSAAEHRRSGMSAALHQDVLKGCVNFSLYYQPLLNPNPAASPPPPGAEVLLRWNHPDYPGVGPAEFVPLLESSGDIVPVGTWVLEQAIAQCCAWRVLCPGFPGFSINVSYQQIVQKDFCARVCRLFKSSGLPAGSICLELTESCRIADLQFLYETMVALQSHGIQTALDDFGTGYANFTVLKSLTPDWVKIDYTLSHEAATSHTDFAILTSLLSLSNQLGIRVCVEGIETKALETIAVDAVAALLQGYLYDKPMSAAQFVARYLCRTGTFCLGRP
ncbi:MAG: GGDEF and EAL domain-containing protein [Gemmiger sp.]|nr:GGDEF and EAL domain-containing protein [Gemmiger sp.]